MRYAIYQPIKRIFLPKNLENSWGGGNFVSENLDGLKTS